ncbi:hypothetical protein NDU88_007726 [Pleurodeles waltl]|uniref:Integrase p58-like C-terminal domain-containing protein n=1 Tax=Pleurodeles waltl TaxID=8319 RepID=A0AAV7RSR0_PLEWA|nr:hypothetical protein NDU88_007726 [Pleurodeles waltl]
MAVETCEEEAEGEGRPLLEYVHNLKSHLQVLWEEVRQNMEQAQTIQKHYYDRGSKLRIFLPEDQVLIMRPTSEQKLLARWQGPYRVVRAVSPVTYLIEINANPKKTQIYHVNLLKKWEVAENAEACSRVLESPATSHIKTGSERRFPDPGRHDNEDIGNPDSRIPKQIPEGLDDGMMIAMIGNPDIRVPDVIENEDRLHARRAFTNTDAEEGDTESGRRKETSTKQTKKEEPTNASPGDTITGRSRGGRTPPRPRMEVAQPGTALFKGQPSVYGSEGGGCGRRDEERRVWRKGTRRGEGRV